MKSSFNFNGSNSENNSDRDQRYFTPESVQLMDTMVRQNNLTNAKNYDFFSGFWNSPNSLSFVFIKFIISWLAKDNFGIKTIIKIKIILSIIKS